MTDGTPIYVSINYPYFHIWKFLKYIWIPLKIFSIEGIILLPILYMYFESNDISRFYRHIVFLFVVILIIVQTLLMYRWTDFGQRPILLYKDGMEKPVMITSWREFHKMKGKKSLPNVFMPYNQIDQIDTSFFKTGDLHLLCFLLNDTWKTNNNELPFLTLHPPLAKEIMQPIKDIVGTDQLVHWLERGKMIFGSDSPESHLRAMEVQRELFGDDVVEKLYCKKGNTLEYTMNPENARHE